MLTDLDPSGVVSEKSFRTRLARYCGIPLTKDMRAPDKLPEWLSFTRIAVTRQQVEEYDLPSRPTKTERNTHARSPDWDGGPSIELDAFAPGALRQIVRDAILAYIPPGHMEKLRAAEESEREGLKRIEELLPNPEDLIAQQEFVPLSGHVRLGHCPKLVVHLRVFWSYWRCEARH